MRAQPFLITRAYGYSPAGWTKNYQSLLGLTGSYLDFGI
jgi:hypothetical protein